MNCPSGHPNADGMMFCTQCGMRIVPNSVFGNSQAFEQPSSGNSGNPFDSVAPIWPNAETQYQPISQPPKNTQGRNIAIVSVISTLFVVLVVFLVATNRSSTTSSQTASDSDSSSTTRSIRVTLAISGVYDCDIPLGYSDIPGAQIEIRADGELVGFGTYPYLGSDTGLSCEFSTTVFDIPSDANMYSVSQANGRRGTIYMSQSELQDNNWEFSLGLGDN